MEATAKNNPYLLHIETTTKVCSVALSKGANLLAFKEEHAAQFTHSENLHLFIESVVKEASITFKDLNGVSISEGPGSYTGLRIGVSAAKGICYALNIPLISTSTLKGMALRFKQVHPQINSGVLKPMLDARRMEVFTCSFDFGLQKKEDVKAEVIDPENYTTVATEYWFGDGAEKFSSYSIANIEVIEGIYPSAKFQLEEALAKFQKSDFEDVAYFVPFYLKDFMATKAKNPLTASRIGKNAN